MKTGRNWGDLVVLRSKKIFVFIKDSTRLPLYLFFVVPPQKRMSLQSGLKDKNFLFQRFSESNLLIRICERLVIFLVYALIKKSSRRIAFLRNDLKTTLLFPQRCNFSGIKFISTGKIYNNIYLQKKDRG
ncbi:hypothetical protein SAMN05421765_2174 [Kaistella antarctica]|uniref:Uncharacterized protein n=1 Tax=Kaistella antarctica TaxID=266748 RepID=A0ABR4TZQ7_9FLAO|nr:hypothetical protein HY04_13650 [Kaistella antarctica]SEW07006.1 hypothetical protein SAMN05421765_2174 [Kaistella antarctica]